MNMLVCIKQVPDTTEIKIDPVNNTLIRDAFPALSILLIIARKQLLALGQESR